MRRRRWVGPAVGAAVCVLVLVAVALEPAAAGRAVKGGYRALPAGVRGLVPDAAEARLADTVDGSVRRFALGDPDRLAEADVRLRVPPSVAPHRWHGAAALHLEWTDLGSPSIRYDVLVAPAGSPLSAATVATTADAPRADVPVPGDGSYTVWVRPRAGGPGHATAFGPFWVDASPPPAPVLAPRPDPPGYRFDVSWSAVTDVSGVVAYEVQRSLNGGAWERAATVPGTRYGEDQIGNGVYDYRVRALNGALVASDWSAPLRVVVQAPMQNPGDGLRTYGVHVNYTGFLHLWDLSDPARYVSLAQVPAELRRDHLGAEPGIEVDNQTLAGIVRGVVGAETNTLRIAEALFRYLFDHADYDEDKLDAPERSLQRAGETLDRGKGICGDLAVLYLTLLRIAGVPARPVHGYLDNARSGVGGFHMWVEAYVGPVGSSHPWITVDVSGITGPFRPESLFAYFGVFNPDYLALGTERQFDRFDDGQWNTWARFRWLVPAGSSTGPRVSDRTRVTDYESELGRLFFNTDTRETRYVPCEHANAANPEDPCPTEAAPGGFQKYYGTKGLSKKRIDYGADLESSLPPCLRVELRAPKVDDHGAVTPDQNAIFRVYETTDSPQVVVGAPDAGGWVTFLDGTNRQVACSQL